MKSNVCKIDNSTRDLAAILKESERVAEYNGLDHKQTLQLRLLCEEIDGMLPNIIDRFEGSIWFEFVDGVCKIKLSVEIPALNTTKKEDLLELAKNKKNAAVVGIVGKIRDAIENFFLDESVAVSFRMAASGYDMTTGYIDSMDYAYLWRLEEYRSSVNKKEQEADWDELEKSVIASAADDVIVGVKGKCAQIVIVKKFA